MGTIGSLLGGKVSRYQADLCTVFRVRMSGAILHIQFAAICFNNALVHDRENTHILKLQT
jgi:hypothetical protein